LVEKENPFNGDGYQRIQRWTPKNLIYLKVISTQTWKLYPFENFHFVNTCHFHIDQRWTKILFPNPSLAHMRNLFPLWVEPTNRSQRWLTTLILKWSTFIFQHKSIKFETMIKSHVMIKLGVDIDDHHLPFQVYLHIFFNLHLLTILVCKQHSTTSHQIWPIKPTTLSS
jgi:hypothetical protein